VIPPLHDSDLVLRQPIQLIDQGVDFRVGGLDLALIELVPPTRVATLGNLATDDMEHHVLLCGQVFG
jgi:hypothetical protein